MAASGPAGSGQGTSSRGTLSRARLTDGDDQSTGSDERKKLTVGLPMVKGFIAGVVVSHLNKNLILGFFLGGLAGVYAQQTFSGVPDVLDTWRDFMKRFRGGGTKDD